MADDTYVMGIDFGTGGVRAGVFDAEGDPHGFHAVEFETDHPRPGRAEQDPDEWWSALVGAVRGRDGRERRRARARSPGSRPTRPPRPWSRSTRTAPTCARRSCGWTCAPTARPRGSAETGDPALKYNGHGDVSAEFGLPKALWIKDEEPEVFERTRPHHRVRRLGHPPPDGRVDRLDQHGEREVLLRPRRGRLAGEPLRRPRRGRRPRAAAAGGADLGAVVGGLRREVAEELGLKAGHAGRRRRASTPTPARSASASSRRGRVALITGSSHVFIAQTDRAGPRARASGARTPTP